MGLYGIKHMLLDTIYAVGLARKAACTAEGGRSNEK